MGFEKRKVSKFKKKIFYFIMSSDQEMEKQFIKDSEQFATVKDKSKWPYDLLGDMYGSYKQATVGDDTASEPYRVQWKLHGQWE